MGKEPPLHGMDAPWAHIIWRLAQNVFCPGIPEPGVLGAPDPPNLDPAKILGGGGSDPTEPHRCPQDGDGGKGPRDGLIPVFGWDAGMHPGAQGIFKIITGNPNSHRGPSDPQKGIIR